MSKTLTYYPGYRQRTGFFASIIQVFENVFLCRELIWQLFIRDYIYSYKKSFLGVGWILISPLIGVISWVFMNATGILHPGNVGIPYPAYVLLSTSIWGLFMSFYQSSAATLSAGHDFIFQVKYPHEALLVKQMLEQLTNFLIGTVLNIVVLFIFRVSPSWMIILLPVLVLPIFFLGAGIGLVISVINVVTGEAKRVLDIFLVNLIFLTPVLYLPNFSNKYLAAAVFYNPLTYLVGGVRDVIVYGKMANIYGYILSSLFAFVVFVVALRMFYVTEQKVIEKMI